MHDPEISTEPSDSATPDADRPRYIGVPGVLWLIAGAILVITSPVARLRLGTLAPVMEFITGVHLMTFYIIARIARIAVKKVSFFFGGALLRWRLGETWFSVNWFPYGGYVSYKSVEDVPAGEIADGDWQRAPRFLRVGIILAGPVAVMLLALLVLGPQLCWDNVARTAHQVHELWSAPPATLKRFLQFVDTAPFLTVLGACAVKISLGNLVPIPLVNGGQALMELANMGRYRRAQEYLQLASLALILACFIFIVYNLLVVLIRG